MSDALLNGTTAVSLLSFFQHILYVRLTLFGSASVILYDFILTFNKELRFIWRKPWSLLKILFLWQRYFGLTCVILLMLATISSDVDEEFCRFWYHFEMWGFSSLIFTTELVIMIWIWVIYNKRNYILFFMGVLYIVQIVAVCVILGESFHSLAIEAHLVPSTPICTISQEPKFFHTVWLPVFAYDSVLLILFVTRSFRVWLLRFRAGNSHIGTDIRMKRTSSAVINRLYLWSIIQVLPIFFSQISCAIVWFAAPLGVAPIPLTLVLALSIIGSTRLLLNVRSAYYRGRLANRRAMTPTANLDGNPTTRSGTPASMSRIVGTLSGVWGTLSVPAGIVGSHAVDDLDHPGGGGDRPGSEYVEEQYHEQIEDDDDEDGNADDDDWYEYEEDWDAIERRQRGTIYANETTRDLWAFELREIRFEGFR